MDDQSNRQRQIQRQVATKTTIAAIKQGTFIAKEGWEPHVVQTQGIEVARVNFIGVIVAKQAQNPLLNYGHAVLDDGSDNVILRSFNDVQIFSKIDVGDVCLVIGRPREFGQEIYVVPEIVRRLGDPAWLSLRAFELAQIEQQQRRVQNLEAPLYYNTTALPRGDGGAQKGPMPPSPPVHVQPEKDGVIGPATAQIFGEVGVLRVLRRLDEGSGVPIDELIDACQDKSAEQVIQLLLQKGDVFEVRPGTVKILE